MGAGLRCSKILTRRRRVRLNPSSGSASDGWSFNDWQYLAFGCRVFNVHFGVPR